MKLTPFGIFNAVAGRISKDFPQGKLLVPYKGLKKGNELLERGDSLSDVLEHVVVIHNKRFKPYSAPDSVFVYDGDKRVRKIKFDNPISSKKTKYYFIVFP